MNKIIESEKNMGDLMFQIEKLTQENSKLKAKNKELEFNNQLLHNSVEQEYLKEDDKSGYTEEQFEESADGYMKELADMGYTAEELGWNVN